MQRVRIVEVIDVNLTSQPDDGGSMTRFLAACVAAAAYGAVLDRGRDEHVACATGRPASRARRQKPTLP